MNLPGILSTRARVERGAFALLPPEGLVENVIPEMPGCRVSILAAPKFGANFIEYLVTVPPRQGTCRPFSAGERQESFVYVLDGTCTFSCGGNTYEARQSSYLYSPPGMGFEFSNPGEGETRLLIHKLLYTPLAGVPLPGVVFATADESQPQPCDGNPRMLVQGLLPLNLSYDIEMNLLTFLPGGAHPFLETHLQQHAIYCTQGTCCYHLSDRWTILKKDDFIWVGPYVTHGCCGVGDQPFTYLFSKVVNRDPPAL